MVGYLNEKNRIIDDWFKLFQTKREVLSQQEYKHWEHLKEFNFPYLRKDCNQYIEFKKFLEHNFTFINESNCNIDQYKKLKFSLDAHQLVFINGKFSYTLSDTCINPWILKIDQNFNRYETILNPIYPEIFLYLIECLSNATVHITLPKDKIAKKPLYLIYINEGSNIENNLNTSHCHHNLVIENNTSASIIEHFINVNKHGHFSGTRMSISTKSQSKLNHTKLIFENHESYHISHYDINVGPYSNVKSNIFIISGPKFTHHQTSAILRHKGASLSLNSLTLLSGYDVSNLNTYLEHNNRGYALSTQKHKTIANNHSVATFHGLIKVNRNAIHTNSKMINNSLLLHESAIINTIPQLEIYADNIKCSHGATIGKINDNHLFTLRTRGISNQDAFKMLIYAFANEITEKIENNVIKNIILKKINQNLIGVIHNNVCHRKN